MPHRIGNIAILATGLIGASWAAFYGGNGFRVKMYDVDKSQCDLGFEQAVEYLKFLAKHDASSADAVGSLPPVESLGELLPDVELVQESVAESYDVKKDVLGKLEEFAGLECIFASSSSRLLLSRMQKELQHPERVLIVHPFNPPHLIPLVELVPGEKTNPELINFMAG